MNDPEQAIQSFAVDLFNQPSLLPENVLMQAEILLDDDAAFDAIDWDAYDEQVRRIDRETESNGIGFNVVMKIKDADGTDKTYEQMQRDNFLKTEVGQRMETSVNAAVSAAIASCVGHQHDLGLSIEVSSNHSSDHGTSSNSEISHQAHDQKNSSNHKHEDEQEDTRKKKRRRRA